ncbi:hypothetical protein [Streptomyces sp. NBC_00996]|uniref:hypothetical protein n=1 Tax=Streptomyces sp. NBC_00996 TaxID=2903710 RepID=UPI003865C2E7|nr:hypothetical protein OG390_24715 [Streptomyces sp. NBC_00996]
MTTHDEELLARVREMRERGSAPKQLAQAIVRDAVTYAGGLGFEPAAGFTDAAVHLGTAPGDRPTIGFGRDGKPFYFSGPYDDPRKVVQALERTCGTGNYHYAAHL